MEKNKIIILLGVVLILLFIPSFVNAETFTNCKAGERYYGADCGEEINFFNKLFWNLFSIEECGQSSIGWYCGPYEWVVSTYPDAYSSCEDFMSYRGCTSSCCSGGGDIPSEGVDVGGTCGTQSDGSPFCKSGLTCSYFQCTGCTPGSERNVRCSGTKVIEEQCNWGGVWETIELMDCSAFGQVCNPLTQKSCMFSDCDSIGGDICTDSEYCSLNEFVSAIDGGRCCLGQCITNTNGGGSGTCTPGSERNVRCSGTKVIEEQCNRGGVWETIELIDCSAFGQVCNPLTQKSCMSKDEEQPPTSSEVINDSVPLTKSEWEKALSNQQWDKIMFSWCEESNDCGTREDYEVSCYGDKSIRDGNLKAWQNRGDNKGSVYRMVCAYKLNLVQIILPTIFNNLGICDAWETSANIPEGTCRAVKIGGCPDFIKSLGLIPIMEDDECTNGYINIVAMIVLLMMLIVVMK